MKCAPAARIATGTACRLLTALVVEGFADQDPMTAKYQIGSGVVPLALRYLNRRHLGTDCLPIMRRLADDSGESVNLGVLSGTAIYYVQQVEGPNPLRFGRDIGLSVPLHCSALGKPLLSLMPLSRRRAILETMQLDRRTENTITDKKKLAAALDAVAAKGYVADLGENIENLFGMAVPVRNVHDVIVAGQSIVGPSMRLTAARRARLLPKLIAAGEDLSRQLGWQSQ